MIVGLGKVGLMYDFDSPASQVLTHARAIKNWGNKSNCRLNVFGIDSNHQSEDFFSSLFPNGNWFADLTKLDRALPIDLAIIATPISTIAADTIRVTETLNIKKLLIEKPACKSNSELKELQNMNLSSENIIVGFPRTLLNSSALIRSTIQNFGKESKWEVHIYYGGTVLNILSHFLDLTEYIFGEYFLLSYRRTSDRFLEAEFVSQNQNVVIISHQYAHLNDELNKIEIFGPVRISYLQSGRRLIIDGKNRTPVVDIVDLDLESEIASMIGNFANFYLPWSILGAPNEFTRLTSNALQEIIKLGEVEHE